MKKLFENKGNNRFKLIKEYEGKHPDTKIPAGENDFYREFFDVPIPNDVKSAKRLLAIAIGYARNRAVPPRDSANFNKHVENIEARFPELKGTFEYFVHGGQEEYPEGNPHLQEAISDKNRAVIDKWRQAGDRQAAIKIVDSILRQRLGLVAADLPDTSTYANGLDGIEQLLKDGNYESAMTLSLETAKEMIEEEGGEGLMERKN